MNNPERHAYHCLMTLTAGFVEDRLIQVNDTKTVPIGDRIYMRLTVLDLDSVKNHLLVQVFDDKELDSYAWKVHVYHQGFARAVTFEQHGTIQLRADREGVDRAGETFRDYETFAKINGFFQEALDSSLSDFLKGYIPAHLERVA